MFDLKGWQDRVFGEGYGTQVKGAAALKAPVQTYRNWLESRRKVPEQVPLLCRYIESYGFIDPDQHPKKETKMSVANHRGLKIASYGAALFLTAAGSFAIGKNYESDLPLYIYFLSDSQKEERLDTLCSSALNIAYSELFDKAMSLGMISNGTATQKRVAGFHPLIPGAESAEGRKVVSICNEVKANKAQKYKENLYKQVLQVAN